MTNIFTKHFEEEEKKLWLEDLKQVAKPVASNDAKTINIDNIHLYKSQVFIKEKLTEAQNWSKKHKGIIAKLKNKDGTTTGYLVQWQDRKSKKQYNEFNYNQLKRELYGK